MRNRVGLITVLCVGMMVAGCSKGGTSGNVGNESAPNKVNTDPVTLTATIHGITMSEEVQNLILNTVKKQYPHITLQIIPSGKGSTLTDLIAAGQVPDIVFSYNGNIASYKEFELLYDMTELLKKHQVDLGRFETNIMRDVKVSSTKDEIYGAPYKKEFHALFYNKEIFDKFGVPYPKDGMTWDQVVELGKRVTRLDNGTQYRGLDPGSGIAWISQPLSLEYISPKTDLATMDNAGWKKIFEMVKAIYSIPGNGPGVAAKTAFMKDKTLAMLPGLNILYELETASKDGLNWDVVQSPSHTERPNIHGNASIEMLMITQTSANKDQAMQVVKAIISDEFQMALSKTGTTTILKNPEIIKAFGTDKPFLKDKNVQGIFKSQPVQYPTVSEYRAKASTIAAKKFEEYRTGNKDVNTILREADEEINKMVAAEKGK